MYTEWENWIDIQNGRLNRYTDIFTESAICQNIAYTSK